MPFSRSLFALPFALTLAFPALAQPSANKDRAATEAIIRDYLMKNPELIRESLLELERREQEAQKAAQKAALKDLVPDMANASTAVVLGNPKGNTTMVEFFDYNCGFCKKAMGDVAQLLKTDPQLRVVLKDFPVLGPDSVEASRVALAAKRQLAGARIWEFHTKVMELRGSVNGERVKQVAKELGLDMAKLDKDLEAKEIKETIEANVMLGDKLGLTGTPAFVIGEEVIFGAVGLDAMRKTVAGVRQCGKAEC